MKNLFARLMLIVCLAVPAFVDAQTDSARMKYTAFDMRSNGKIYVVVTVILIILLGLLGYMFRLDRKIARLEKGKPG